MNYALMRVQQSHLTSGLLVSTITIYGPEIDGAGNVVLGASGAPTGVFNNPILTDIPCMDSVPRDMTIEATEMREIKEIQSKGYRHISMAGEYYYMLFPLIQAGMQAVVTDLNGSTTYNLFGAEPSSQHGQTRLHLEVISV
jgi:hypothetical protein